MRNKVSQDVDIDQLEAGEIEQNSRHQGWHHERWPVGTFNLSESEQFESASISAVLKHVQRGTYDFHILDLAWSERSTSAQNKIIAELTPPRPSNSLDHPMLQQVARLNYRDSFFKPGFCAHIRELSLANTVLEDASVPVICKLLTDNAALSTLDLSGNDLGGSSKAMADLGAAVGSSGLRHFKLNSNPLSPASFVAFLDALPAAGCSLHALDVSNVLQAANVLAQMRRNGGQDSPNEETLEAARTLAALISDPQRSRNLAHLRANGNSFGFRGVRAITNSVVGHMPRQVYTREGGVASLDAASGDGNCPSPKQDPNTSLVEISLRANIENGWEYNPQTMLSFPGALERCRVISVAAKRVPVQLRKFVYDYLAARPWLRRPDSMKAAKQKPEKSTHDDVVFKDFLQQVGGTAREWARDLQEVYEMGSCVDLHDWKTLLRNTEAQNAECRDQARLAAFRILAAARVIGCRARRALPNDPPSLVLPERGPTNGPKNVPVLNFSGKNTTDVEHISPFPFFLNFPPEVRMLVLRHLDNDLVLSEQQFHNVVSFACEPSTINYGANLREWTTVVRAARTEKKGVVYASATLPAQPWSWSECFAKRSAPRRLGGHDSFSTCVPVALLPQQMAFLEATATQHADSSVPFAPIPLTDQGLPPRADYATQTLRGLETPLLPFSLRDNSDDDQQLSADEYELYDVDDDFPFDDDDELEDNLSMDDFDSGDDYY